MRAELLHGRKQILFRPRHGGNDDTNYLDEECSTSSHSFASGASNVETSITLDGLHMMDDVY